MFRQYKCIQGDPLCHKIVTYDLLIAVLLLLFRDTVLDVLLPELYAIRQKTFTTIQTFSSNSVQILF
jgi:hypothetical protein